MRKTVFVAIAVCFALSSSAKKLEVDTFRPETLRLAGSYCQFGAQQDALLVSDWDKKFWMKIDGKMVAFLSKKSDSDFEQQLQSKRWQETLRANEVMIHLDLVETARGDDSAAFRGYIDVQRGGMKKHLLIAGGCGA